MFRELLVAALCECFMRDRPLNDDRTIFGSSLERIGREIVSCYFSFLATITVGLGGMYHDALLAMLSSISPSALDTLECGKTCIGHITWSVGIVCFFTTTSNHDCEQKGFQRRSQLHRDDVGQEEEVSHDRRGFSIKWHAGPTHWGPLHREICTCNISLRHQNSILLIDGKQTWSQIDLKTEHFTAIAQLQTNASSPAEKMPWSVITGLDCCSFVCTVRRRLGRIRR